MQGVEIYIQKMQDALETVSYALIDEFLNNDVTNGEEYLQVVSAGFSRSTLILRRSVY